MKLDLTHPAAREAHDLMKRLEPEPAHVIQVCRLAVRLFDLLERVHALPARDRMLLQCAALLHDIGWSTSPTGKAHHKHSAKLIRRHTWESLDAGETGIVAQVARYHRRSLPAHRHAPYARLGHRDRRRVCALASLLRLADSLDRSHHNVVRGLTASFGTGHIRLTARTRTPAPEEEYAFLRKRDLFVKHFETEISLDIRAASA